MDKVFAAWCLCEYQSPRSTPTLRRKTRSLRPKVQQTTDKDKVKFRLLSKDDVATVREIYEEGHMGRILPAFKIGISRHNSIVFMIALFFALFVLTRSLAVCLAAEVLYSGAVLICFYKLFNDHISRSLMSDLADIEQYYKTHESCHSHNDFNDNASSIWVAVKGDDVIGFVSFSHIDEDTIELKRLGVSKNFRHNGVGSKLCEFAIQFLKAGKYQQIVLETTEAHKAAQKLYRKFEFFLAERKTKTWGLASLYLEQYKHSITRPLISKLNDRLTQLVNRSV